MTAPLVPEEPQSWQAAVDDDAGVEELRRELEAVKAALEAHDARIYAADLARLGSKEIRSVN